MLGQLTIVPTPIGNMKDISGRALDALGQADVVICEDTRITLKLLNHYGIHKRLVSMPAPRERMRVEMVLSALAQGQHVALVTDSGTPGISDPGAILVAKAIEAGHGVVPIPGPSSVVTALSGSGLKADGFVFLGFLSKRLGRAQREIQKALMLGKTVIFFESPFRINRTLEALVLDHGIMVVIAREVTKIHEEFIRGSLEQVKGILREKEIKGEVVVLLGKEIT